MVISEPLKLTICSKCWETVCHCDGPPHEKPLRVEIERLRAAMMDAMGEIEDGRDSGAHLILKIALSNNGPINE